MRYILLFCAAGLLPAQELTERERMLLQRIEQLEKRLTALEQRSAPPPSAQAAAAAAPAAPVTAPDANTLPGGVTFSMNLDGYYGYNFNRPYTGYNSLRGYDVSANSFSLNQADLVVERAPDVAKGQRWGARLDLMFGQATETLQGSASNERRPEVMRHIFQAYGTYVAPIGKGLTTDFGKFTSSFGMENNYTKDQLNYSRSYWFSFLPFYHMGFRTTYPVTGKLNASYWLVNGLNQTEDFNGFKSHAALLNYNPTSSVSANLNYFNGREERAVNGVTPRGRTHIIDSYVTWQASSKVTVAAEADYAINRVQENSAPVRVMGGAGYFRYRFTPRFNLASRFSFLRDDGGLFTGRKQDIKDATATATFDIADGFQMRWEYRRDWSDAGFFLTENPNLRKREQNTALLGLIWWFGGKRGTW